MSNAAFNWTKYLFKEVRGSAMCLVYGEQIGMFKDYNLADGVMRQNVEKYKNLTDAESVQTPDALLAKLQKQQGLLPSFADPGSSNQDQLCNI